MAPRVAEWIIFQLRMSHQCLGLSSTNSKELCACFPALALVMPGRQSAGFPQNFLHMVGFQSMLLDVTPAFGEPHNPWLGPASSSWLHPLRGLPVGILPEIFEKFWSKSSRKVHLILMHSPPWGKCACPSLVRIRQLQGTSVDPRYIQRARVWTC